MKFSKLFQSTKPSLAAPISCCNLVKSDCNQGRNCPLRKGAMANDFTATHLAHKQQRSPQAPLSCKSVASVLI